MIQVITCPHHNKIIRKKQGVQQLPWILYRGITFHSRHANVLVSFRGIPKVSLKLMLVFFHVGREEKIKRTGGWAKKSFEC